MEMEPLTEASRVTASLKAPLGDPTFELNIVVRGKGRDLGWGELRSGRDEAWRRVGGGKELGRKKRGSRV